MTICGISLEAACYPDADLTSAYSSVYENDLVSLYFFPSTFAGADVRRIRFCHRQAPASKAFRNRNGATFPDYVYQCHLARAASSRQTRETR